MDLAYNVYQIAPNAIKLTALFVKQIIHFLTIVAYLLIQLVK
jgi:hypothetical protein